MDTPLEIHALKQMPALEAARRLVACTRGELCALCTLLGVKVKRSDEPIDLVNKVLAISHPLPAPAKTAPQYVQERIV
jgi:hypothetical protein